MRRRRAKITDAVRTKVRKLVKAGKTGSQVANVLGISLPSVQNIKKALGLVKPAKKATSKPKARQAAAKPKVAPKAKKRRLVPKKAVTSDPNPSPLGTGLGPAQVS